ncbi:hypothetical protein [Paenibacillus mangrovi]|nr:hypothetical protein [Paenibacillus mangrovi]
MNNAKKQSLGIVVGFVIVVTVMAAKWLIGNVFVSFIKDIIS